MGSEALQQLLERGVLYDSIEVPDVEQIYFDPFPGRSSNHAVLVADRIPIPQTIRIFCTNAKCEDMMDWFFAEHGEPSDSRENLAAGFPALEYRCKHTPENEIVFFLKREHVKSKSSLVRLVGCDPRRTPYLSNELNKALGQTDLDRYSKALDCRSRGLGVAALVYMRRVIESEMDRIIDLILETLPDETEGETRTVLNELKGDRQFENKAAVADARLPSSFFPGSQNPFARLHDLTSDGVHNLDDVESAERFDECRDLFEMLFQKLLRDRQTQRLYRERLTTLKRKSRSK